MTTPFVIFALPRSRTAWLSKWLTYRDWQCGHDEVRHWRTLDDVGSWLAQPCTGTVETAAAPYWRLLGRFGDVRVVVVRRPIEAVVASLQAALPGVWETERTTTAMQRLDRKLEQITRRVPDVLSLSFDELATEDGCRRLWEHCLPYSWDGVWWRLWSAQNVQNSLSLMLRYYTMHEPQIARMGQLARHRIIADMRPAEREFDGVTFKIEPFASWIHDAAALIREHCAVAGRKPEFDFNAGFFEALDAAGVLQIMMARIQGRPLGYLLTIVGPSLEGADITEATHTAFYASPDVPGVGMRMMRAANEALRERGADLIIMRAGVAADGHRLGAMYRRLGARPFGEVWRLDVEA